MEDINEIELIVKNLNKDFTKIKKILTPQFLYELRKTMTITEITNKFDLNENTLVSWLRLCPDYINKNCELKRSGKSPTRDCKNKHDEIIELTKRGIKKIDISDKLELDYQTLVTYIRKNKIDQLYRPLILVEEKSLR